MSHSLYGSWTHGLCDIWSPSHGTTMSHTRCLCVSESQWPTVLWPHSFMSHSLYDALAHTRYIMVLWSYDHIASCLMVYVSVCIIVLWSYGIMVSQSHGLNITWSHGHMVSWSLWHTILHSVSHGHIVIWSHGHIAYESHGHTVYMAHYLMVSVSMCHMVIEPISLMVT